MTIGSTPITLDLTGIERLLGTIGKQETVTTNQNPISNSVSVAVADPNAITTLDGVEASDAASITVFGRSGRQLVTILANQTQAGLLAEYLVRPAPEYWFSSLEVLLNGIADTDRDAVAELEIGDQIRVSKRFPNVANPVVQDLFVEGIQHDISLDRHVVRLYCAPASLYELFRLNGYITTLTRTNLTPNPSAETNTTGWAITGTATGTMTRSTAEFYAGTASVARAVTSSGTAGVGTQVATGFTPGDAFTASFYVKSTVARSCTIAVNTFTSGNVFVNQVSASGTSTTSGWTRFSVSGVIPATADRCRAFFTANAAQNGETHYIDAVLIEKTSELRPYFDGGTADTWTGYTNLTTNWTGTTNNSTSTSLWGVGTTPDSVLDSPAVGLG